MQFPIWFPALLIAIAAFLTWSHWRTRNAVRTLQRDTRTLAIQSIAATLAAPHINPSPDAQDDNLLLLAAWERTAYRYIRESETL